MPELPEVETLRAYVDKFCVGCIIVHCNAAEQGGGSRDGKFDELVIVGDDLTEQSFRNTLEGRTIVGTKRRGKQMWFVLDKPPHLLVHFGMTGSFTVKGEKKYEFCAKIGAEWPPKYTKLELQMSNGVRLALTDPRRIARVRLCNDPEASPPISLLGPDPLTHPISLEAFAAALAKPTAPIKAVLLAQDRVVSGVGNWMSDEVCFQAGVHPGAACNTLSPEQVLALHAKLLSVCREACDVQADYTRFPREWIFHHRWGKGKSARGIPRVSSGHPIVFDVVGGRTTALVPAVQRKGLLSSSSASKTKAGAVSPDRAKVGANVDGTGRNSPEGASRMESEHDLEESPHVPQPTPQVESRDTKAGASRGKGRGGKRVAASTSNVVVKPESDATVKGRKRKLPSFKTMPTTVKSEADAGNEREDEAKIELASQPKRGKPVDRQLTTFRKGDDAMKIEVLPDDTASENAAGALAVGRNKRFAKAEPARMVSISARSNRVTRASVQKVERASTADTRVPKERRSKRRSVRHAG